MLRHLFVAIAMLFAWAAADAQTHYKPHVSVGGKAGLSIARIELSPAVPQSWLLASNGAVTFRYAEEKLFGLVAEFGWTQLGWKENFEEAPLEYSRTFTYLTLPVMTQIIFGSRRFKCFINLGPQVGYMIAENISANFDYHNLASVDTWPERKRQTDQLAMPVHTKFDYGIAGGLGFEFYIQPKHSVLVEARYYFGLGNVFRARKVDVFSASRCTAIEVTFGYNFRLK